MAAAMGKIRDVLGGAGGFQVSAPIREADDGVCVADIDPLRVAARREEGNAVGAVESRDEDGSLAGFAIGSDAAEDLDFAGAAFRQENIAVGGGTNQSRIVESSCVQLDGESVRPFWPRIIGAR